MYIGSARVNLRLVIVGAGVVQALRGASAASRGVERGSLPLESTPGLSYAYCTKSDVCSLLSYNTSTLFVAF